MVPMFSWPMITGVFDGGVLYSLTSVPQIPATSIFTSALSSGTSGIGYYRNSVLLGPVLTAACTFSTTAITSNSRRLHDLFSHALRPPSYRCRIHPLAGNSIVINSGGTKMKRLLTIAMGLLVVGLATFGWAQ